MYARSVKLYSVMYDEEHARSNVKKYGYCQNHNDTWYLTYMVLQQTEPIISFEFGKTLLTWFVLVVDLFLSIKWKLIRNVLYIRQKYQKR